MLNVKKVEILNDYELSLKYDLLRLQAVYLGLEQNEIENRNYSVSDLREIFGLKSNIIDYIEPISVIEISLSNGSKHILSNFDLAQLFSWVDHCEFIFTSWHQSYVMLAMNSHSGQHGIIAIWECNENKWIFFKQEPHVYCFYYCPPLNRFLGLITLKEWGTVIIELFVIKPTTFIYKTLCLHHASSNNVVVKHRYLMSGFPNVDLTGSDNIETDDILFDDAKRACYVSATGWKGKKYYFKIPYDEIINL